MKPVTLLMTCMRRNDQSLLKNCSIPKPATTASAKVMRKKIRLGIIAEITGSLIKYNIQPNGKKPSRKVIIANHLKKSYINWNKDSITDDVIFKNLKELSEGELKMDESAVLSSAQELRGPSKPKQHFKNNKFKHKHKHNHGRKH